jgi:CyaY protein
MEEARYQQLADEALRRIEDMLADVDADLVDPERAGDVLTLTFASGKKAVINTQRPTRQIWVAANARAWHFSYDEATQKWMDDKGQGVELLRQIASIVKDSAGVDLPLS